MYNLKYYSAFASNEIFGAKTVKKLYDYFGGDIESAWNAEISAFYSVEGITIAGMQKLLNTRDSINPDVELEKLESSGFSLLTYEDDKYPELLKQIPDAPMWLYYKGNIDLLDMEYKMAVVGSRKCSITGKSTLAKIIGEFQNSNLCIVSGLALGIDAAAHQAALDNNIPTIAVLGSGLRRPYPLQNKKLFNDIIENGGLVLSEYPLDAEPISFHFPMRNRIVSGLSECTLVAEAALKSGALITARLCLEQNRELLCIPGAISNPATAGIYKLLKEGAGIVTCGQDILNNMGWELSKREPKTENSGEFTEEEELVLDTLRQDSLTIDELALKCGLHVDNLMIILTRLELEDLIIQAEGDRYCAL